MSVLVNAYCTVRQPPEISFSHQLNAYRGLDDPALIEHLKGLARYVVAGGRGMNQRRYAVLRHVERVRHHYSLTMEDSQLDPLSDWARQANAILFVPDGSITDPDGKVLLNPTDGSESPTAQMPYPVDARNRKKHHDDWLRSEQIPIAGSLPPTLGENEVLLRGPVEVALRRMALTLVAIRAESLNGDKPIPPTEMQSRFPLAFNSLTPSELQFMQTNAPDAQAVIDHAWKYEAADTLRWALMRSDELVFPDRICNVPQTAADVVRDGPDAIVAAAELRPLATIVDQVDLHLRLLSLIHI